MTPSAKANVIGPSNYTTFAVLHREQIVNLKEVGNKFIVRNEIWPGRLTFLAFSDSKKTVGRLAV